MPISKLTKHLQLKNKTKSLNHYNFFNDLFFHNQPEDTKEVKEVAGWIIHKYFNTPANRWDIMYHPKEWWVEYQRLLEDREAD